MPHYIQYFGPNNVEGVAENRVEVEMSCKDVDGAVLRWVEVDGARLRWGKVY